MYKLAYFLSFVFFGFIFQQKPWELAVNKEEIKVYTRKTDSTSIKEYKVTMVVKSPIDTVLKKILDIKNLKKWSYHIAESALVKKINDSAWIFYIQNDIEWPVKDRDHVSKVQLKKKKEEYNVFLTPYNNFVKEKEDVVRLTKFKGLWTLKKINTNQTQVTQQLYGDPESNIPPFFINMMIAKAPFHTFKNMKSQLEAKNSK
ncbi:MAG: START domain-containing protein [Bacteroidota bacterium]